LLKDRNIWVIDIEQFKNFHSLCGINIDTNKRCAFVLHESRDDRIKYLHWLNNCKAWITFNGLNYDYPLAHNILENKSFFVGAPLNKVINWLFRNNNSIIESKYSEIPDSKTHIPQYDLYKINHYDRHKCSLKWVQFSLKWKNVRDLPIAPGSTVYAHQIDDIIKYNFNDVESTLMFWNHCQKSVKLRKEISTRYNIEARNMSNTAIGKSIVAKYYSEKTGKSYEEFSDLIDRTYFITAKDLISDIIKFESPELKKFLSQLKNDKTNLINTKFEKAVRFKGTLYDLKKGGLHSKMPPMLVEEDDEHLIVDMDFGSYYPNLMILLNAYPPQLSSVILDIIKELTDLRLKAKAKGDKSTSDALKLAINSCYGLTGNAHSFMYSIPTMLKVTINGQLLLLMLIEKLYKALEDDMRCFYANTKLYHWCSKTALMRETGKAIKYQPKQVTDFGAKGNSGDMVKTFIDTFTIRSEATKASCVLNDHRNTSIDEWSRVGLFNSNSKRAEFIIFTK
jgi:hypothetical protein